MRSHNIGFHFYLFSHPEILIYCKFFSHVTKPISNHHFFLKALDTICQLKNAESFWAKHLKYYGKTHFIFFDLCTKTSLTVGCWLLWLITIKKKKERFVLLFDSRALTGNLLLYFNIYLLFVIIEILQKWSTLFQC